MRIALMLLGLLALAPPVRAGVYNLAEQHPPVPLGKTRGYILDLRSAAEHLPGLPNPELFRAKVLRHVAELERTLADGVFSPLDRVDLSGCYLRLGRTKDALNLLLKQPADHFMLQANLASAYFLSGELEMAIRTQGRVLAAWPAVWAGRTLDFVPSGKPIVWAGWTEQERLFHRECERALLRLYEKRREETRDRKSKDFPIDPIFPGLRFVGPEGIYVAGGLSPAMRDRLPVNGGEIVFQLCKWYPTDRRLYWQLGELLNVYGQIGQASDIFNELVDGGPSGIFLDLPAHRRVLRDALPAYREIQDPNKHGMLLSQLLLIPRPMLGAPVIGEAAYAASSCAAIIAVPHLSKEVVPPPDGRPVVESVLGMPFEWRHLLAAFAFGFLIAALLGWQLQVVMGRKSSAS
jgi:hypothetical protein